MTSINVGLFGHIDHGKTEVARRLTEIVSTAGLDKHPEAQRRGITIDLGFTSFILNEYIVTLVDVPGHADLIRNVVAGADIIDAAILVIDAQKGPEVQTGEHILILNYFGIKNLVVALNKVDLVNKDQTEKVGSQIKKVLIGTIFENAPIVPISAKTGEGILQLKEILYKQIKPPVRQAGPFKMPIDHAFEIKGIGTVITGTILRGEIRVGDKIQIQPIGNECKIKSIQTFKESRAEAKVGDRVGMHITGISAEKIYRGCVACQPGSLIVTNRIEAEMAIDQLFKYVLRPNITIHANAGML
ncbi:MAG: selenocysteine-specific translation elongation factor, partial [Euryarchaeota archaeon]|nr:selenocysteine-specific translation elongation factor [Euryarchaeota archaeon]